MVISETPFVASAQGFDIHNADHVLFLNDGSRELESFLECFFNDHRRGVSIRVTLSRANRPRSYQYGCGQADEKPTFDLHK
jgi:hypothetical protein